MIIQYVAASLLLAAITAFIILLNIGGREERLRRARLPIADQQRLDAEDALWQQRYGP